jgi:hypothetical protein
MILASAALLGTRVAAQSTQSLTLKDAERIAIQNLPQIQAALVLIPSGSSVNRK